MASQWFCRVLGQVVGPVSFQDLREMVRAGTLSENDPVRRKESSRWEPAREVIGLFRTNESEAADAVPADSEAPPEPAPVPREPAKADQGSWTIPIPRPGRRAWLWMGGAGVLVLVAVLTVWAWQARQSRRFPEPQLGKPRSVDEESLAALRAPRPEVASLPGLKEGVPTLVPGLEEFDPVHSVCFSADLRTIVFSAAEEWRGDHDLYLATRANVADPFQKPERIESCTSGKWEVSPALSPDGLDLIFVRPYVKEHFFHASRASPSSEFAEPIPWPVPGLDPAKQRVGHPRFCGPLRLVFNVVDLASKEQTFLMAGRGTANTDFEVPREIDFGNFGAWAFLSEDGLRYYSGSPKGLSMAVRRTETVPFGFGVVLVDAEVSGPVDVPIWVAPQEDVIFYGSPGPGKELGSARKLWMVRF